MSLRVHAKVPYGNVCEVEAADTGTGWEVSFASDPHGGPECLWFCFRIEGDGECEGRPEIRLILKHVGTMLGTGRPEVLRPVVRYAGGEWERLEAGQVETLSDGRLRAWWTIATPDTHADVAFCYPYGQPQIEALVEESDGYWRGDVIGVSQGARPIVRLSNDGGAADGTAPGLYLIARQHSGETPGSWVLDGLLREMAEQGDKAPLVWAVPLSNVDGVEGGDYGKDNFPYDLNRAWGIEPMRHETLVIQRDMQLWRKRCRPVLTIDFHAPGGCESDGIYCFLPKGREATQVGDAAEEWAAAIHDGLRGPYAAENFQRVATYASRWNTPNFATYCAETLETASFSMETPYAMVGDKVLTVAEYREAGSRIARAIVHKLQGSTAT